jgi:hypothetical protein
MTPGTFLIAALVAAIIPVQLTAQNATKPKPDSSQGGTMDDHHMMGPWKEMNAFHRVMAATWHPASQKGDVAPLKARVRELLTTADAWAASKPPSTPASCGTEAVRNAATKVATESKVLVALIDSGADDARVKAALKGVHDSFEIAEKGCGGHG